MYAPLEVDCIGWAQDRLTELLDCSVSTETPAGLEGKLPWVQLVQAGGVDDRIVVDQPRIVSHCFAATPQEARALALRVGTAWRTLVGQPIAGAIVVSVDTASSLTPIPNPNSSVREVVRTDTLRIKTTFS